MTATLIVAAVLVYLAGACLLGAYLRRRRRQSYGALREDAPLEPKPPHPEPGSNGNRVGPGISDETPPVAAQRRKRG